MDLVLGMLFKICAGKSSGFCVVNWHNNSSSQPMKKVRPKALCETACRGVLSFYRGNTCGAMRRILPHVGQFRYTKSCVARIHATYSTFNAQN